MKHSDVTQHNSVYADILLWVVPLLLLIPSVALDFTEILYSPAEKAVNVLVPCGVYLLLMAAWRRNGITTLCLVPLMGLCAFQIVLLFLYGESIIAVDMFLNVTTTNPHEAGELLSNLTGAIIVVCALYIPPIALAIVALVRGSRTGRRNRRAGLVAGAVILVAGGICAAVAFASENGYRPERRLFPVNVIKNMFIAGERTEASDEYTASSEKFSFKAQPTHPDSVPEIFVLVIGETSRADNWQLDGYDRPTNPRLSKRTGLLTCPKALSESNTTHKSVPLLLSHLSSPNFNDSIYYVRSVIDAFSEAGFSTRWLSNQKHNGSLIDFFANRADSTLFITDDGGDHYDLELCPHLHDAISEADGKIFIVVHTYGSHFNYTERYPESYHCFGNRISTEASKENRKSLIDAYDNAIRYTDAVVDSIIDVVDSFGRPSALVYLADHGEDIYDDRRERFLHASPTPTYWQLHVPMLIWMSESYRRLYPEKYEAAAENTQKNVSSSRSAFHTLVSLAGIKTPYGHPNAALTEKAYTEPSRVYLNDYNEGVPLDRSGLRNEDFRMFARENISY